MTIPSPTSHDAYDADVLIVGAGPTGLTLGAMLAKRHVRTTLIDRQAEGVNTSRAAVIHARTLEALEDVDIAGRLVARGIKAERFIVRDRDRVLMPIEFTSLPTRYPYTLMLSQAETEATLLARMTELGGRVLRPQSLTGLVQDAGGVTAKLEGGGRLRARYLVGADGMHSVVRQAAGIGFTGAAYGESFVLADVRLQDSAALSSKEVILFFSPAGMAVVAPLPDGVYRVVATVDEAPEHPDAAYVQALLDTRGPEAERAVVREVVWGSRFRVHHRLADTYRAGRVLLAGDAAHVHSPAGGQGMNLGIIDATLLAGALVEALDGNDAALDAYGAKRRPAADEVVHLADRMTRLATVPRALRGLRNVVLSSLALLPAFRRTLAWRLSGLVYR